MRILILALTLVLGLTLNAKAENGITKTDSIHFINGVLIMANDTISLDEFIVLAERRSGRSTPSKNDEAIVRYIRQAKKAMTYAENPEMTKKDRAKRISGEGVMGTVFGAALAASGFNFQIIGDTAGSFSFYNLALADLDRLTRGATGGAKMIGGAIIAATSLGGTAVRLNKNKISPLMSSAHHKLEANQFIDKAVSSHNKRAVAKATSFSIFSQTEATDMKAVGSKIDTGDLHITVADAEAISFSTFGQTEMWAVGSKIYVGDLRITLADAREMSITHSPEAYVQFKKAKNIRAWYLSGIAAFPVIGYGAGTTVFGLIFHPPAIVEGLAIMVLGGGLMAAPSLLIEPQRKKLIISGIELYNKAIAE